MERFPLRYLRNLLVIAISFGRPTHPSVELTMSQIRCWYIEGRYHGNRGKNTTVDPGGEYLRGSKLEPWLRLVKTYPVTKGRTCFGAGNGMVAGTEGGTFARTEGGIIGVR